MDGEEEIGEREVLKESNRKGERKGKMYLERVYERDIRDERTIKREDEDKERVNEREQKEREGGRERERETGINRNDERIERKCGRQQFVIIL
jgi:hypothetical protein